MGVNDPLTQPVHSPIADSFFALDEGGRLVGLEVENDGGLFDDVPQLVTESEEIEDSGESLAVGGLGNDEVFVPQPGLDEVQAFEDDDLQEAYAVVEVGENPVRVAADREGGILYALSADGSTVAAVDLETRDRIGEVQVGGSDRSTIAASPGTGGRFWVAGPEGVVLHEVGGERPATFDFDAVALAVAPADPGRAFAAEADSGRVVAVEEVQGGDELALSAETDLGEEVLHLAADETGLYALTGRRILSLDPQSLEVEREIDLATDAVREAGVRVDPSGLALGESAALVTLEREPRVLLVGKPAS